MSSSYLISLPLPLPSIPSSRAGIFPTSQSSSSLGSSSPYFNPMPVQHLSTESSGSCLHFPRDHVSAIAAFLPDSDLARFSQANKAFHQACRFEWKSRIEVIEPLVTGYLKEEFKTASFPDKAEAFKNLDNHEDPCLLFDFDGEIENYAKFVRLFVKLGGNINFQDAWGDTPLHEAVSKNHYYEEGSLENEHEYVKILLNAGANADIQNNDGNTPLMLATFENSQESTKILAASCKNLELKNNYGETALIYAVKNFWHAYHLQELIDARVNLNAQNHKGETALMIAMGRGNLACIKLLVENGASIDIKDKSGKNVLHWRLEVMYSDMFEEVVYERENEDENDCSFDECLWYLLDKGAPISSQDAEGNTLLHLAVKQEDKEFIELLLSQGASYHIKNKEGLTAAELAKGDPSLLELFEQRAVRDLE